MKSKRNIFTIITLLFCLNSVLAQLVFDDNFDNGYLGTVIPNGNLYELEATAFLHFRIIGAIAQSPEFRVNQGNDYIFRNDHRMIFRAEGDSAWQLFDNGYVSGPYYYFSHSTPFSADTVYIAYWYTWTLGQMADYLAQISGLPYVRNDFVRGYSFQNRPIYGYEVTDPAVPDPLKKHLVIVARQHADEPLGSHIARGISDYLIYSNDPPASELRRKAVVHFYPMGNPDGVYLGQGYGGTVYLNLNRYWYSGAPSGGASPCIETDLLRQAIWDDTGGSAAYAFDLHSHPGHIGQYYWWGLLSGPTPQMVQAAAELVNRIHFHDAAAHGGASIIAGQIVQDTWATPGLSADYWFVETLGAVGYTFEPGSVPPQSLQRITEVGIAFCKGLNDVLDMPIITDLEDKEELVIGKVQLFGNYPNPFNPSTTIRYSLPKMADVSLKIYNIAGQLISTLVREHQDAGEQKVIWEGRDNFGNPLGSGIYIYRLRVGKEELSGKTVLIR